MTRRRPVDVLMARHGWDGYAAVAAWADAHRRGPASPWWPEVSQAIGVCIGESMQVALTPVRQLQAVLREQMEATVAPMAALFGRLAAIPRVPHPTIAIQTSLPRLAHVHHESQRRQAARAAAALPRPGARPAFLITDEKINPSETPDD